ncbi:MAG: M1 family aminopeptidase, partial [Chloroflexota bacterium]
PGGTLDLDGRRMEINLTQPLNPGCTLQIELAFQLTVPPIVGGAEAYRGYFGRTVRQINLGHWLPTVVPYQQGEWLQRETLLIGEQLVLAPADWDVTIEVLNAVPTATVAAPGQVTVEAPNRWRYQHTNGREFAASISEVFDITRRTTDFGYEVEIYTMPDGAVGNDFTADVTAQSLDLYAERFGPYLHERLVIVQGDFPDGMEFSGFAFVSTDWFARYTGDPASYLMLITVHEVAHQWWYDLVGSDQALSPWLDEAPSTYAEYIYIEEYYPQLADWWWYFRVNRLNPEGNVDSAVYDFDQIRPYINAVYLRGVLMLHEMRITLGDEAFFAWLEAYAVQNAGEVANADALWAALTDEQFALTGFTRASFLRNPGVR